MVNIAKRILLIALTIMMTMGVSGCMKKKATPEEIKQVMLKYLEDKYSEEFEAMSLSPSGFAYSYDNLRAYPKNGTKGDSFEVWGTRMDDGTYSMRDGYFGIYIKPKYEEVMSGFVGEIYKDFKLYVDFGEGVLPNRLNKDTKIEEIYSKDEHFLSDTILFVKLDSIKENDVELDLRKIATKMRDHKLAGFVRMYIVLNDKFESIGLDFLKMDISKDKDYILGEHKSIGVTPELKIRQNGEEVETSG